MSTALPEALDNFLEAYIGKIDSGFGLIQGDVQAVFATLIVISVGVSAILWAVDETQNVPAALIRKILLFGIFAWLITSWHALSLTVVNGFGALGLKAAGGGLGLHDLMNSPSKVVGDGIKDAAALMKYVGQLSQEGFGAGFIQHIDVIACALLAAIGLILAFLVLGVEIAVTIIEFHLVTLIALVTVPFGILTQTAFLSERAIGYVASVGIKLMAIAIIVSIGETIFAQYTVSANPGLDEDCGLLLSGLLLLILALKVPPIAGALISGGPQLSAGATIAGAAGLAATVGGLALVGRMGAAGLAGGSLAKAAGAEAASGGALRGGGSTPAGGGGASGADGGRDGGSQPETKPPPTVKDVASSADEAKDERAPSPPPQRGADAVVARARARRDRMLAAASLEAARLATEDGGASAGQAANLRTPPSELNRTSE
jgi:type IV secretion system protein TrbL